MASTSQLDILQAKHASDDAEGARSPQERCVIAAIDRSIRMLTEIEERPSVSATTENIAQAACVSAPGMAAASI
jgi:hypothetical protein